MKKDALPTEYDLIGRPTNATDSVSLFREWLYNPRSELAAATIGTNCYGYAYDAIGNRLWAAANAATYSYSANSLNQYTSISNLCASVPLCEPSYDADGNLLADGAFSYAYDAENRLVSVTSAALTNGAIRVLNGYDHKHRRVRKTVQRLLSTVPPPPSPPVGEFEWQTTETHTFVYDGNLPVHETVQRSNGSTVERSYYWGMDKSGTEQGAGGVGGLLAVSIDGVFHFPCYDHNGNIVRYLDAQGDIVASYTYDAFGNIIAQSGPLADFFRHRFSTKYFDAEIGLYYYGYRFYSPELMRWINRDPIEEQGGANLYAFCGNNPIEHIDAFGEDIWIEKTESLKRLHHRVCVTYWKEDSSAKHCCNGKKYRKFGRFCISFGPDRGEKIDIPESTTTFPKEFANPDDNGDGIVYQDLGFAAGILDYMSFNNDVCYDLEIMNYMKGLISQKAEYFVFGNNCRKFSRTIFDKFKGGRNR